LAVPTFVNAGTRAQGTANITPGAPGSPSNDDIWLLLVESDANDSAPATPSGWTSIGTVISEAAAEIENTRNTMFWHRYAGSDPTREIVDTGDHTHAAIYSFRGCIATGDPIHQSQSSSDTTMDTGISITGATTTIDDCLIVVTTTAGDNGSTASWSNGGLANPSITEATTGDWSTNQGNDGRFCIAYGGLESQGASGTTTATGSTSEEEANWCIALRPLAAALLPPFINMAPHKPPVRYR